MTDFGLKLKAFVTGLYGTSFAVYEAAIRYENFGLEEEESVEVCKVRRDVYVGYDNCCD